MEAPVGVIGHGHCSPDNIDVLMDTEDGWAYINSARQFEMKKVSPSFHRRLILQDAVGNPIVTLCKKIRSFHNRWEVYRGENNENSNNLLFSVKKSSMWQREIRLDVILANNSAEEVCDFKIKVVGRLCVIYAGEGSSRIIAEVERLNNVYFKIRVSSNIDRAFIVSLVFILDTMMKDPEDQSPLGSTNVAIQTALGVAGTVPN